MPIAPDRNGGTRSPHRGNSGGGVRGGKPGVGQKGDSKKNKGGKKKKQGKNNFSVDLTPLNPPFDPRMRGIGSPLNQGAGMRRGWFQTEEDNLRVNFLFNPSELALQHQTMDSFRSSKNIPEDDTAGISYASMGSQTGVKLLYDRTYELYDNPNKKSFVARFGVMADVAAWYVLMGMLPEMPTNWESGIITEPPQPKIGYLFIGPKMVYYGRISGVNVTYSHWTQRMVPVRCAIDIGFEILPYEFGVTRGRHNSSHPTRGNGITSGTSGSGSWTEDLLSDLGDWGN